MSPEQLNQLKELSEQFTHGHVNIESIHKLSYLIEIINERLNLDSSVASFNNEMS